MRYKLEITSRKLQILDTSLPDPELNPVAAASWAAYSSKANTVEQVLAGVGFDPHAKDPQWRQQTAIDACIKQLAEWGVMTAALNNAFPGKAQA